MSDYKSKLENITPLPDNDPYAVKKCEISPFFIFEENVTMEVLCETWSFWKWLKAVTRFKFAKFYGNSYYFKKQVFLGRYISAADAKHAQAHVSVPQWQKNTEDNHLMDRVNSGDYNPFRDASKDLENTVVKAYISIPSKSKEYDLVLGELDDEKNIVKVYRCKRPIGHKLVIFREVKTLTEAVLITSLSIEEL